MSRVITPQAVQLTDTLNKIQGQSETWAAAVQCCRAVGVLCVGGRKTRSRTNASDIYG